MSSALRSLRTDTPSRQAHVSEPVSTAPSPIRAPRSTTSRRPVGGRLRTNAQAVMTRSEAEPTAIHKGDAEDSILPAMSETKPSITHPYPTQTLPETQYGPAAAAAPELAQTQGAGLSQQIGRIFDTEWRQRPWRLAFDLELAFLGHTLKRLARVLDPVLVVIAVRWQQPDNLIASARSRTRNRARSVEHGLADAELMALQTRPNHCHVA